MNGLTGMEKFSHLEDKIYLTIEFVKKLALAVDRNQQLEAQLQVMLSERDAIQLKVEAMLEAMTVIDPEVARAIGR